MPPNLSALVGPCNTAMERLGYYLKAVSPDFFRTESFNNGILETEILPNRPKAWAINSLII